MLIDVAVRSLTGCNLSDPASTQDAMQGDVGRFDPSSYLQEHHPDVEVVETDLLPGGILGCVDHELRTIWLSARLTPLQRRCTLAYEIGHLQQGPTPPDQCLARAYQRAAEEWAALMLIPSEDFVAAWANCLDLRAMAANLSVDLPTFRARIRAASDADQDAAVEAIGQTRLTA